MSILSPSHNVQHHASGSVSELTWRVAQSAARALTDSDAAEATMTLSITDDDTPIVVLAVESSGVDSRVLASMPADEIRLTRHLGLAHLEIPGIVTAVFSQDGSAIFVRCEIARDVMQRHDVLGGRYELRSGFLDLDAIA